MKHFFIFLLLILSINNVHAQKLKVESFVVKTNDITARTQPRQDINGNDCALIKVQLAASKAVFSGNVVGDVSYKTSEYLVYMPEGSKRLSVKLEGFLPLEVNFEEYGIKTLESKTTYVLTISGASVARQIEAPKINTGWIILESEPSGASVYINDEFVGNTPLSNYKQAYGTYQYRIESPNYHPATGTIELNAGRFEQRISLKPAFGSISVNSNVAGANILLDGKPTGKNSPATLTEIPSGSHAITLQLDKYAPRQQEVIVEDGQTASVSMSLDARFARITIYSLDGAEIYSNDKLLGKGRISEDIMEGYYDIEAKLDHHKTVTKQIQVVAGQSQEVTLNPIPIYGSLDITSTPHDADITIDGKSYGKTPLTIEQMLEGEHTVTISLDGFTSETRKISIVENEAISIDVALGKKVIKEITKNDIVTANRQDKAEELYNLGLMYHKGTGVTKNYEEALKLYREAAEQGNSNAKSNLGVMYKLGQGVTKNYAEALKWYREAAEQGNAVAKCNLGYMYKDGTGVAKNYKEAIKWFKEAAEQGNAEAKYNLGSMYEYTEGMESNYEEAIKWYKEAAVQGYARAKFSLGIMYENGEGVAKNYEEAIKWYREAAEQGHAGASYCLGCLYEVGLGVAKNYEEAIKLYEKAAEQGHSGAKKALERLR